MNSESNFKCKVCNRSYKGVAAFRIHSLDVHGIENPELSKLLVEKMINYYLLTFYNKAKLI